VPASPWQRYVAIGDSFTEGMVDPDPVQPDAFVGWADRLAASLDAYAAAAGRDFAYANLAVRGRKLDDIVGPQLEAAVAMGPDLVSMVGGGNDILRPSVDLDILAARLEEAVIRLRASGADVLLATPSDTRDAGLFAALRGRHAVHTANLFTIAERHGAHVLNLWGCDPCATGGCGVRTGFTSPQPATSGWPRPPSSPWGSRQHPRIGTSRCRPCPPRPASHKSATHLAWARTHAAPWVERRVRGTSSGSALSAKRPLLQPISRSAE
jgi:hypothetical protein